MFEVLINGSSRTGFVVYASATAIGCSPVGRYLHRNVLKLRHVMHRVGNGVHCVQIVCSFVPIVIIKGKKTKNCVSPVVDTETS